MAITLDTIVNKVFKTVKNGYDNNEVESFLDEILEEMEIREAETNRLKEKIVELTRELEEARSLAANHPVEQAPSAGVQPTASHSTRAAESFEIVLSKAKIAYEEIVTAADVQAEEIVSQAKKEAATIRSDAEAQITDLTEKLCTLKKDTASYFDSLKAIFDEQNASMEKLKELL